MERSLDWGLATPGAGAGVPPTTQEAGSLRVAGVPYGCSQRRLPSRVSSGHRSPTNPGVASGWRESSARVGPAQKVGTPLQGSVEEPNGIHTRCGRASGSPRIPQPKGKAPGVHGQIEPANSPPAREKGTGQHPRVARSVSRQSKYPSRWPRRGERGVQRRDCGRKTLKAVERRPCALRGKTSLVSLSPPGNAAEGGQPADERGNSLVVNTETTSVARAGRVV